MKALTTLLTARLLALGIVAALEVIPGEGGGIIVRVGRLAHVSPAEAVARQMQADFGVEILVSF